MKFRILAVAFTLVASIAIGQQPTWTDPAAGLMWTATDNGSNVTWQQASNYCQNLSLGGYSGWRLPTIDELAGIYDKTQNVDGKHIKGGIKMTRWWGWSSSVGNSSGEAWAFNFIAGNRFSFLLNFNTVFRALCVRRSGQ
jgi:hypothetical protein